MSQQCINNIIILLMSLTHVEHLYNLAMIFSTSRSPQNALVIATMMPQSRDGCTQHQTGSGSNAKFRPKVTELWKVNYWMLECHMTQKLHMPQKLITVILQVDFSKFKRNLIHKLITPFWNAVAPSQIFLIKGIFLPKTTYLFLTKGIFLPKKTKLFS